MIKAQTLNKHDKLSTPLTDKSKFFTFSNFHLSNKRIHVFKNYMFLTECLLLMHTYAYYDCLRLNLEIVNRKDITYHRNHG